MQQTVERRLVGKVAAVLKGQNVRPAGVIKGDPDKKFKY